MLLNSIGIDPVSIRVKNNLKRRVSVKLRENLITCPLSPVQTDVTLLANNSQHYWMLYAVSVCTPCCMVLGVFAQSLKPVKR